MKKYDCIIIGAGNGGLISGITLLQNGYKVLILEAQNTVGGVSKPVKKGRFVFEPSYQSLFLNNDNQNSIQEVLKKIEIEPLPEFISTSTNIEIDSTSHEETIAKVSFSCDIDNFKKTITKLVPDSNESVEKFFALAEECSRGIDYISKTANIDYDHIENTFPEFYKIGNYTLSKVLDMIKMPLEAQEIINSFWIYLGSPEGDLSFSHYASFMYNILKDGIKVPKLNSYDISLSLLNKYLELGGEIRFNNKVVKIITEENAVKGVRIFEGKIFYSDYIISNLPIDTVYRKLIDNEELPSIAKKALNQREIGGRPLTIYLGLNRTAKNIGLEKSIYLLYETLDSDLEFNRMKNDNSNEVVICWNNINPNSSPTGTCALSITTMYFDDCFGNFINIDNYDKSINDIANKLIKNLEDNLHIHIKEFIEEIHISTPLDYAFNNDSAEGNIFGYRYNGMDNLLPRLLNHKNENYIDRLYFCGGFTGDIYGCESTYNIAYQTALNIIKRNRGFKNGKR